MATYVPEPPVNIPRRFRTDSAGEYFGSRSIFTGIFEYPWHFDQNFRKGGLEIREFIAGEVFIRPTRVIVVAAIDSVLVLAP